MNVITELCSLLLSELQKELEFVSECIGFSQVFAEGQFCSCLTGWLYISPLPEGVSGPTDEEELSKLWISVIWCCLSFLFFSVLSALPSLCFNPPLFPACDPHTLSLSLCEAHFCVFPPFLSHLHAFTRFWHKLHLVLCGVQTIVSVELCSSPLSHLFPFTRFLWRAAAVLMSRAVQVKLVTLGSVRGHLWIMMMRVHVKVWRQVNTASIPGCHTVSSWKRAPLVSLNTWIPQSANHVYIDLFCTLFVPFIFGQHEKWDFKP